MREVSTFIGHVDHFNNFSISIGDHYAKFSIAEHYAMLNRSRPVVYSVPDPVSVLRLLSHTPPRRGLVFVLLWFIPEELTIDELRWLFSEVDAAVREADATPVFVALANADEFGRLVDGLLFVDLSKCPPAPMEQAAELIRVLPGLLLAGT